VLLSLAEPKNEKVLKKERAFSYTSFRKKKLLNSKRESTRFALSPDEPGAVTFTPVAGRVQVGGDFAFEA
jgi:hypothetical protein